MTKYKVKIELLSDLCQSSGKNGPGVDIEIRHDKYGIPVLGGKSILGRIKESAQELCDLGVNINVGNLFGKADNQVGMLDLDNAYIENYESLVNTIVALKQSKEWLPIVNPTAILNSFSYIRTVTSINDKTGAAEETSLRKIRVVKKDTIFWSEIEFSENDIDKDILNKILLNAIDLGYNRTSGLGDIRISLGEKIDDKTGEVITINKINDNLSSLDYSIYLDEPVIMLSVNQGEQGSMDYIEGGRILGLVAAQINAANCDVKKIIPNNTSLCFGNAFLAKENNRLVPCPNAFVIAKLQNDNPDNNIINLAYGELPEYQTKTLNGKYCLIQTLENSSSSIIIDSVQKKLNYHHQRPIDKSIGHAINEDFYQLSAIDKGQTFMGSIYGNKNELSKIQKFFKQGSYRIGYNKKVEYGKVMIKSVEVANTIKVKTKSILLVLESPLIMYNDCAVPTTELLLFEEYLKDAGFPRCLKIERKYVNYKLVGGFNTTWNRPKPIIKTINAGSSFMITFDCEVNLEAFKGKFLGERNVEGYGQFTLYDTAELGESLKITTIAQSNNHAEHIDYVLLKQPLQSYLLNQITAHIYSENIITHLNKTQVSRLYMMSREFKDYIGFSNNIKCIADNDFCEMAKSIINLESVSEHLNNCLKEIQGEENYLEFAMLDKDKIFKEYFSVLFKKLRDDLR